MSEPRIPGSGDEVGLPCGETVDVSEFTMGTREFDCECGESHAVVMDVHPPSRFLPESLVEVLREAVDADDAFEEFGTPHLVGMVIEEYPDAVRSIDRSDDSSVGFGLVWIATFDARRFHEIVVELVVEMMDHAVSHADDESAVSEFERRMREFDVNEFVEQYREQRGFESEFDEPT
ncbi:MAG: hypothetical protein ACI9YT_000817 [Halobacteriales archaeon]|jgi:hypothetical protein